MAKPIIYWKCDPKVSAQLVASWKVWRKMVAEANKLARSLGAECAYFGSSFRSPMVCGFQFKEPPLNGFKKLKNTIDGYAPRAGTELDKKIRELRCDTVDLAAELTGIEQFGSDEDVGLICISIGIKIVGKTAYLSTRGKPLKGGKRISDLEFEKLK